ncbi:hypothetical protein JNB91_16295 [Rhizobium wenxiniae]|nr:hypothetical protein [Rhizobium wenxiniae]MBW9089397.1 hypothetical protein [Rhizobium wenxiniae]
MLMIPEGGDCRFLARQRSDQRLDIAPALEFETLEVQSKQRFTRLGPT